MWAESKHPPTATTWRHALIPFTSRCICVSPQGLLGGSIEYTGSPSSALIFTFISAVHFEPHKGACYSYCPENCYLLKPLHISCESVSQIRFICDSSNVHIFGKAGLPIGYNTCLDKGTVVKDTRLGRFSLYST